MWGSIFLATAGLKGLQWLMENGVEGSYKRVFEDVDIALPIIDSGAALPLFFGTVRIRAPILAWWGGVRNTQVPPQIVAYKGSFLYVLGIPCPNSLDVKLREMYIGERRVSEALIEGYFPIDEDGTSYAQDLLFFGGPGQGGSLQGRLEFRDGLDPNQTWAGSRHEIMWVSFSTDPVDPTAELLPGYRGMTCVALSEWEFGESARPDAVSFRVTADCSNASMGGHLMVNGLDANPIAVLYALITHNWFGLGYDSSVIDGTSFNAAAIALKDENLGVSGSIETRDAGLRWIADLLDMAEAAFFKHPETGLYTIKLIRNDYDPELIPVLDASVVESVEDILFTTYEDAVNEVIVRYVNVMEADSATASTPAQNTANISQSGNRVRSVTRDYPWASNEAVASRLAARDLAAVGTPLFVARIVCTQAAYGIYPGDAVKLVWPQQGWEDGVIVRVMETNQGPLGDERIVLTVIQDRFGITYTALDAPPTPLNVAKRPWPIVDHVVEEMPFTLQTFAMFNQYITDTNLMQRMMYLATPLRADTYQSQLIYPDDTAVGDMPSQTFCARAKVETAYQFAVEPYDTLTGLRISGLTPAPGQPNGVPLVTPVVYDDISRHGVNLIYVSGEIMAFEDYTDLGGGVYRLENVWRALMDTAPNVHAVGEDVYFLNGDRLWLDLGRHVGRQALDAAVGASFRAKLLSEAAGVTLPSQRAHEIEIEPIRRRWRLPARVADLKANGAKAIVVSTEGFSLSWKARQWGLNKIVRGDLASEFIPSTTTTFVTVGQKFGAQPIARVDLVDTPANSAQVVQANVTLGRVGHGTMLVGVETRDFDENGDEITSWQWPWIAAIAHRWRNLLLNHDLGTALTNWTTIAGTPDTTTDSSGLGGLSNYVEDGNVSGYTIEQIRDVDGYDPNGEALALTLLVGCYLKGNGSDEYVLTGKLLSSTSVLLDSDDLSEVSPSVWTRKVLLVPYVADVAKVGIRFEAGSGELVPSTIIATEFEMRVGQVTAELVTNGSFESGSTGWTVVTGSFTTGVTTTPFERANYIRGGSNATNEWSQTVAVPAGFEAQATALYHVWTMRDGSDTDDTGEVILEALDGGGSVLDSVTTGVYTPSIDSRWERKQLSLDLPTHTISLRLRLRALRVTDGGAANICFDDARGRIHKALDITRSLIEINNPVVQPMPSIWEDLVYAFPTVTTWGRVAAVWGGDSITSLLPSAPVLVDSGIEINTRFVGRWDGTTSVFPAWRFPGGVDSADLAAEGSQFGNVRTYHSWTAIAWIRIDPRDWGGSARGLFGRRNSSRGWEVTIDATGHPVATIYGSAATVTVASTAVITDGRAHRVGIRSVRGSPGALTIIVDDTYTSISNAGVGDISTPTSSPTWFRVGRALAGTQGLAFQVQSLHFGFGTGIGSTAATTDAELDLMYTSPEMSELTPNDTVAGAVVVPDVLGGVGLRRLEDNEPTIAWDPVGGRWALAISRTVANMATSQDFADWIDDGGPGMTVTLGVEDVEGFLHGVRLAGTNSNRLAYIGIPTTTNTVVRVTFFARLTPGATQGTSAIRVILEDTDNNFTDDADVLLTTSWQRVDLALDFSTGTEVTSNLGISPSNGVANDVQISGPYLFHQGSEHPIVLPYEDVDDAGGTSYTLATAPATRFAYGGQIRLSARTHNAGGSTGQVIDVANGTDNVNRRLVEMVNTETRVSVYNASGTGTASEVTDADIGDATYHTIDGRWSRAGLIDAPTSYGGVRVDGVADYDNVAAFTVDVTSTYDEPIVGNSASPTTQPNLYIASIELNDRERLF